MIYLIWLPFLFANNKLETALSQFQGNRFCEIKMVRHYQSELLQSQKTSDSVFYQRGSKFRLEQVDSTKSVLIFDGKSLWVLEFEGPNSSEPEQVSRSNSKNSNPKLKQILDYRFLKSNFDITKEENESIDTHYSLTPIDKKQFSDLLDLKVVIKAGQLSSLSYQDEMENKIRYEVRSIQCKKKAPKGLFNFEPKDKSTVIEL